MTPQHAETHTEMKKAIAADLSMLPSLESVVSL